MALLLDMFSYTFMVRAVIVGLLVSLCASLLGVSLVLKRYAMIGTALGNVGFASMVSFGAVNLSPLAIIIPAAILDLAPLTLSMPIVIAAAFLLLRVSESSKIKGDSAVALISSSSLAIGVIIVSQTTGLTLHVCSAMFGSILVMTRTDLQISVVSSILVFVLFVLLYKQLFAVTYDESFAKATGVRIQIYKSLLAILTAVTVVLGMRIMGALLISSLIIFPALSAMHLCKSFLSVVVTSAIVSVICFLIGISLSFLYNLPTGASVVGVNLAVFLLFGGIALLKTRIKPGEKI